MPETPTIEASNPVLGSLKVSGATLNTIFTIFGFIVACFIAWVLWLHHAQAGDEKVQAKENARIVSEALKESNKAVAEALKESNVNTVKAIEALSLEQKRSTRAMKEIACLNDPAMRFRSDARDFCKRMSRDDQ